ncbi:MAG: hypothetical protein EAZ21_11860 [Betaproteobacteria bacterium]|nr:MAG: hypothetical protein EAZ21_11860 [Betaproteobacteria bacterium]
MRRAGRFACLTPLTWTLLALLGFLGSCSTMEPITVQPASLRVCPLEDRSSGCPPPTPREFRAVWIATVANIDWPTKPGLSAELQKSEVIAILNRVQALNMNAVLLQVRPGADAIYPSALEPWAEWLTGEQGKAPGYDPLQFWIDEARLRGIEVHAWFNPYRARHTKASSPVSADHVAKRLPAAVKSYGGFLWLDPGDRAAQEHSHNVIMDVLRRYDIDGVHFDDYFYPYPVVETAAVQQPSAAGQNAVANALNSAAPMVTSRPERELDFPDEPSWLAYVAGGGKLTRADWRRDNVNRFVERVYRGVKAEKPWVRFGISPFGIGRPDRRPPGIQGFSQYDKLYADVELWLQRGWLDYLAPQLYWAIDQSPQSFPVLLEYWHAQNTLKRDIFPGLYTSRIEETPRGWQPKEIEGQLALIRSKRDVAQGHIHFSMAPIMQKRRGIDASLSALYRNPAISYTPGINLGERPNSVGVDLIENRDAAPNNVGLAFKRIVSLEAKSLRADAEPRNFAVWLRYGTSWQFAVLPVAGAPSAGTSETTVPRATSEGVLSAVAVSVVDRSGRESDRFVKDLAP